MQDKGVDRMGVGYFIRGGLLFAIRRKDDRQTAAGSRQSAGGTGRTGEASRRGAGRTEEAKSGNGEAGRGSGQTLRGTYGKSSPDKHDVVLYY